MPKRRRMMPPTDGVLCCRCHREVAADQGVHCYENLIYNGTTYCTDCWRERVHPLLLAWDDTAKRRDP